MKSFTHSLLALALGAAAAFPLSLSAQTAAKADLTEAQVRKVDKENRKITLKHGAIKSLDMPPMTMVFGVSELALLDRVKAGDTVRFSASQDGGKYTVTDLQPVK